MARSIGAPVQVPMSHCKIRVPTYSSLSRGQLKVLAVRHVDSGQKTKRMLALEPAKDSSRELRMRDIVGEGPNNVCVICLERHVLDGKQAFFTAECGHIFHFVCIAANVRFGQRASCPLCRTEWKHVPWGNKKKTGLRENPDPRYFGDESHSGLSEMRGGSAEQVPHQIEEDISEELLPTKPSNYSMINDPEVSVISLTASAEETPPPFAEVERNFTVLITVKGQTPQKARSSRPGVDLVTVLDLSGSMAGQKLERLKEAMKFVVSALSEGDRLAIVRFSSEAISVLGLTLMDLRGKSKAMERIEKLEAYGGTNIVDGVKKGLRILNGRQTKNMVTSMLLLSDGQDNSLLQEAFKISDNKITGTSPDCCTVLKTFLEKDKCGPQKEEEAHIPIHTFGFGLDHDPIVLHAIAECSRGSFSFIQGEENVTEGFAQCLGGLLSVVAQKVLLELCVGSSDFQIARVHSGTLREETDDDDSKCVVDIGDLYGDEEKNILAEVWIQPEYSDEDEDGTDKEYLLKNTEKGSIILLSTKCTFLSLSQWSATAGVVQQDVFVSQKVQSGFIPSNSKFSRQQNRLKTVLSISEANKLAESGDFKGAQELLRKAYSSLDTSIWIGDNFSKSLGMELKEMMERMANEKVYKKVGRAFALSSKLSHSSQRASVRGEGNSLIFSSGYQTPSMVQLLKTSRENQKCSSNKSLECKIDETRSSTSSERRRRGIWGSFWR